MVCLLLSGGMGLGAAIWTPLWARAVGFAVLQVPSRDGPAIPVAVWYPSDGRPRPTSVGLFRQSVVAGGRPVGRDLPLVTISHGTGGNFAGHSDTALALAQAGFVVAAPTYLGDNVRDQSRVLDPAWRVRQLEIVTDYMITAWYPGTVDPGRIGAFGFSAGGLTALIAAGGTPDLRRVAPHCRAHPAFFVCRLVQDHHAPPGQAAFPWDRRIRAIVVAAPALGFAFTPEGLRRVTMPVQLWQANDDRVLPPDYYAAAVRRALPRPPEFHAVANAGHFDFLAPCSASLARIVPSICASAPDFDRVAFHHAFNAAVTAFFVDHLGSRR
ncbi:dienelactone hydrolase family protein [Nguyenibacter vanlangensis]|uniref:Dienelactone hydrolase family protein n=1 Tax=Nguyenibacter vanlangensis TaxID=1216886 RepID=A0ABZ3DAG6_9PROT